MKTKIVSAIACLSMMAPAQEPRKEFTFQSSSNLVIVNVEVKDKSGKPMEGLKKGDFVVTEDGKPQPVSVFEFQKLSADMAPPLNLAIVAAPGAPAPPRPAGISSTTAGVIRYQDRRLMVLLFDFSSMPVPDQIRAQEAALQFLQKNMTTSDLVSIMTNSSRLRVEQDFTDDRETLAAVIKGFHIGESSEFAVDAEVGDSNNGVDNGAAFIPDDTEFNIFNTDKKLSALESAAKMLAALPEKKALVYFSSGISKTGTENQSQLRATINAAVRSNVSFYPIDSRGLIASPPAGDASMASQRGTGVFTGSAQRGQRDKVNDQQETLYSLAADTGGKAFFDNNDLALGITQAQKDVTSYYILGYYSSNPAQDGKFRRVKVSLDQKIKASLDYRSGYFSAKQFEKFNSADKERQLEEALLLGDPLTDLRMVLEVDYFRLTKDTYYVPVSVKIPASQIGMKKKGSDEITEFDFIGQVRDSKGRMAGNVRDGIKVKLNEAGAAQRTRKSFQYNTGFTLPPGDYKLKFLSRENQTGKMGTFETSFKVPDLAAAGAGLKLSSVVWSSQREPLSAAVGDAGTKKKVIAADPLVQDGQRLVPSITRAFRKDQNLLVYLEVYDTGTDADTKAVSVSANVSFFLGDKKAFESPSVRLSQLAKNRRATLPLQFQVPLAKLLPGQYTCQINIVDEIGRKFAFPRGSVVVLP